MPKSKEEPEIVVTGQKQVVIAFDKVGKPERLGTRGNPKKQQTTKTTKENNPCIREIHLVYDAVADFGD